MCLAVLTGILSSISEPSESEEKPSFQTPTKFIACIRSERSAARIRSAVEPYPKYPVKILQNENVKGVEEADVIILGCKPYMLNDVLNVPGMRNALRGKLLISVLAGVTAKQIEETLDFDTLDPERCTVVRAMPNTAAMVREAMTTISIPSPPLPKDWDGLVSWIFTRIGKIALLPPTQIDVVTALAGSGPAFAAFPNFVLFQSCEPDVPCITPATYAIIGAASALGGATRMTVSIVVIMFELTGALTYVIPIMIAVMLSKWCGDIFGKRGIYESWIHFNEYPFLDHKDDKPPPDVPVSRIMTNVDDLTVIPAVGHTIESLKTLLAKTRYRGFPVVLDTSNPILLGYISRNELSHALESSLSSTSSNLTPETQTYFVHQPFADPSETLDLRPWMDQTPITLNSHTNFSIVLGMFQRLGLRYVLFVHKGNLRGLLTKKDVWFILNGMEDRREKDLGDDSIREANSTEVIGLLGDETPHTETDGLMEGRRSMQSL